MISTQNQLLVERSGWRCSFYFLHLPVIVILLHRWPLCFLYFPAEVSLTSILEVSWLRTTAFTPFSRRLNTSLFISDTKVKIMRQTISSTSLSPCLKKSKTNGVMWNVKLSPGPVGVTIRHFDH